MMKYAGLVWLAAIAVGCTAPTVTRLPLTWEQIQRVGEISVDDPSWKGDLLRLPIRVNPTKVYSFAVLHFKSEVSENLICISASREISDDPDKTSPDEYEVLIELPKEHLQEYIVVYKNPDGGYERLRSVPIPETLKEKLGQ